jgi:hypothetical protein
MEELNNYLIYFLILLCICLILFYLFYKLNNKVNISNQKLDTLDKFLTGVLLKNVIPKPKKSNEDKSDKDSLEDDQPHEDNSDEDQPEDQPHEYIQNKEKSGKKTNLEKIIENEDSD